jgi:hypothetical protein
VCCDKCPGAALADTSRFARRRLLKTAVFQPQAAGQRAATRPDPEHELSPGGRHRPGATTPELIYRTVTGQITDVSPHLITIGGTAGERRFALTAGAKAWRGFTLEPSALRPGDEAVIRLLPSRPNVADRIWANIGRVTGTVLNADAERLLVAEGATRQRIVVIPPQARERIQVRFPNLKPGYLVDLIGMQRRDYLEALIPASISQPPYRGDLDHVPAPSTETSRASESISGPAVWHDPGDEPYGVLGVSYPAIDPSARCAEDQADPDPDHGQAPARALPYLAIGTALNVRNECTGISWTLPITSCAPVARLFNDHCVACRISPRGRVADLTVASFVALGGDLEAGCFHATLTIGR